MGDSCDTIFTGSKKEEGTRQARKVLLVLLSDTPSHSLPNVLTLSDFLDHAVPPFAGKDLGILDDATIELADGGSDCRGGDRGGRWHGTMERKHGLACCLRMGRRFSALPGSADVLVLPLCSTARCGDGHQCSSV